MRFHFAIQKVRKRRTEISSALLNLFNFVEASALFVPTVRVRVWVWQPTVKKLRERDLCTHFDHTRCEWNLPLKISLPHVASICSNFIMGSQKYTFSVRLLLLLCARCAQLLLRCWWHCYVIVIINIYRFLLINFNTFMLTTFIVALNGAKPAVMKQFLDGLYDNVIQQLGFRAISNLCLSKLYSSERVPSKLAFLVWTVSVRINIRDLVTVTR